MKKKFTMLFAALLAFVGVAKAGVTDLPQISTVENPIYYTIRNTRSSQPGGLMYYAGDNVGLKDKNPDVTGAALENKYKFFFTGSHDEMYVHNAATGLKLASVGSWTEAGTAWAVGESPKGGGLAFGPKGGLNGGDCWNEKNYATDEKTSDFTTWSANDDGSIFVVELAENCVLPVKDLFYVIECPLFEQVQGVKKGLYETTDGSLAWGTIDLTDKHYYWIPTSVSLEEGTVLALKNAETGKFLGGTGMSETAKDVTIKMLRNTNCQFNIVCEGVTLHANNHSSGNGNGSNIVSWGGEVGSASAWTFVQKNDPSSLAEVVVKYEFTYEGETKYTQEGVHTLVGEEWPAITTAFPFGVSATKPAGEVSAEGAVDGKVTKVIELAVNLPFTYAADYASIENWYYMNIHTDHYYLNYAEGESMALTATAVPADQKDAYSWAFVGDPFNGYQLVNKVAGEKMILSSSVEMKGNNGGETYPVMTSTPVAEGNNTYWVATKSNNRENGFYLEQKGYSSNKMNRRGGFLAYWSTGADAGSTFVVELRDDAATLQALVADAEAKLAAWNQTGVGYVTASAEDKAAISEAVAAAKTAIANKTGYDAAQAALEGAVAATKTYTIQPEEDVFYILKNNYTGRYMNVNATAGLIATDGGIGIGEVFQFVNDNGNLYLKNVERGTYVSTALTHGMGQNSAASTTITDAKAVVIKNLGKANHVSITPVDGATLHHDTNNNNVVAWNAGIDSKSSWTIEAIDITALSHVVSISDVKWSTLVLGYDAIIPEGVTAYAVTEAGNNVATLTEITGTIPAYEAVLLNAEEAVPYAFKYATESADAVEGNLLKGSTINKNVEGLGYVLAAKEGNVGLYKAALNVSTNTENDGTEEEPAVTYEAFLNNAFKAYLPVAEGAEAPAMFTLGRGGEDEDATGIDQLINNGEVVIYDLAGRRVEKMEKGIYIVNGKKVVK